MLPGAAQVRAPGLVDAVLKLNLNLNHASRLRRARPRRVESLARARLFVSRSQEGALRVQRDGLRYFRETNCSSFLDAYDDIPYRVLCFLTSYINYGDASRITSTYPERAT